MNLVRRSRGSIKVFGLDNIEHDTEIKDRIGFVYDTPYYYEDIDLGTLASSVGPFYSEWDRKKFSQLLDRFGISPRKKFVSLSKGTKTKFSLALALSHDADLIILDEPTAGLDPLFRREFLEMLTEIIQDEEKSVSLLNAYHLRPRSNGRLHSDHRQWSTRMFGLEGRGSGEMGGG